MLFSLLIYYKSKVILLLVFVYHKPYAVNSLLFICFQKTP